MRAIPPVGPLALALLASALLIPACPARAAAGDGGGGETVRREGYSVQCPEGWSQSKGAVPGVDLALSCAADPRITITVARAPAGADREVSEASAQALKEMFKASIPGYRVTAEEWGRVDGARAYRISARYALRYGDASLAMQNAQALFIRGDSFFTITYTATPELFMDRLGDFEKVLGGFRAAAGPAPSAARR